MSSRASRKIPRSPARLSCRQRELRLSGPHLHGVTGPSLPLCLLIFCFLLGFAYRVSLKVFFSRSLWPDFLEPVTWVCSDMNMRSGLGWWRKKLHGRTDWMVRGGPCCLTHPSVRFPETAPVGVEFSTQSSYFPFFTKIMSPTLCLCSLEEHLPRI